MRHAFFLAKRHHLPDASHSQACLDGPRLIVEAAVQDPAIVARLVPPHSILFFQDGDPGTWLALAQTVSGSQPHDASANDQYVLPGQMIQGISSLAPSRLSVMSPTAFSTIPGQFRQTVQTKPLHLT